MKRKETSKIALERMREADRAATWEGEFKCCGRPVRGTPAEIVKQVAEHLAKGCKWHTELVEHRN